MACAYHSFAMTALRDRWNKQVNKDATMATAFVSLDLTQDELERAGVEAAKKFIVDFGVIYLQQYKLSPLSAAELKGTLWVQLSNFATRKDIFSELDERVMVMKLAQGAEWTASTVWGSISSELATVARVLLSIPASEASVERTFSAQDSLMTKKRNRLADSTVQASMFVLFNTRAMRSTSAERRTQEVELSLDFMETDTEREEDDDEEEEEEEQKENEVMIAEDSDVEMVEPVEELRRTYSVIAADTMAFIKMYIQENGITTNTRWGGDRRNALEAAAAMRNPGGPNTEDLLFQVKAVAFQLQNAGL